MTCLLEKERGNCYVEKLRAICLLEADFNWLLRYVFAKAMINNMRDMDLIPVEQIAAKGKTAIDGVMQKQLFYDSANALHRNASLSSTDAANCYDAVNHPICSLSLQAMSVGLGWVLTYLRALQTMTFYLKTGFGMAKEGYGGTELVPYMGLTQGSCASPPVWTAVSTAIVRTYRREGYGVEMWTAWSGLMVVVAAILFVDDTDLLHLCTDEDMSEYEFVLRNNQATYFWAKLLQATGGNLKPPKCYEYLMLFKFTKGEPSLKTLSEMDGLPSCVIPQPDSADVAIERKACEEASETLGVFTSPAGTDTDQLDKILLKAVEWCESIKSSSLSHGDVWHSLRTQLIPSISYSLVPMLSPPEALEEEFMDIWYDLLPHLNVNRNITTDWRWIPVEYQGLGLPNVALEKAAAMLQYLVRHWDMGSGTSVQLRRAFEIAQIECGLEGNFLRRDYEKYKSLMTHGWMKVLWNYVDYFGIKVDLEGVIVPVVRERDKVFMELVIEKLDPEWWRSINRVRHHKKIYFLSQLLNADGSTALPDVCSNGRGVRSMMLFPYEEPTRDDFKVWDMALRTILSPALRHSPPLGKYLRQPYDVELWWKSSGSTYLFCTDQKQQVTQIYKPAAGGRESRSGNYYVPVEEFDQPVPPRDKYVTATKTTEDRVRATHEQAIKYEVEEQTTVLQNLLDMENTNMWLHVDVGETGNWIRDAIVNGTLVTCHDGSHMINLAPDVNAAALTICCTKTRKTGKIQAAERNREASNNRGEGIGGILNCTLLHAATKGLAAQTLPPVRSGCDNMGIVGHCNDINKSLPENQKQADVIRSLRRSLAALPVKVQYEHVYGHLDDTIPFENLSLLEQLNVVADQDAKAILISAVERQRYITPDWPYEGVRIYVGAEKVTSSIKTTLYSSWGRKVAKDLMVSRGMVAAEDFDLIAFAVMKDVMMAFPQMFRVWICKLVSDFAGTNRMLSNWQDSASNTCPCCGQGNETIHHVTTCPDPGRVAMFHESVLSMVEWLSDTDMEDELALGLLDYLLAQGTKPLRSLLRPNSKYQQYAAEHDRLGWDNFLEGRVSQTLFQLQQDNLVRAGSSWRIQTWAKKFVQHLLEITHRQWSYRNAKVHLKKAEGRTAQEHEAVMGEVRQMMLVDPSELLPEHRALLHTDYERLGSGTTVERIQWVEMVEGAINAKRAVLSGNSKGCPSQGDFFQRSRRAEAAGLAVAQRSNQSKTEKR